MTNNQLAENSVIQLLNSVKLARDNAERADNRVDHSFYYALTIALEELQERRKAAMNSEPVGYFGRFDPDDEDLIDQCSKNVKGAFPLYRHAQQPVVPASQKEPISFDEWSRKCALQITLCYPDFREKAKYIWDSARETQQPAPVVPDVMEPTIEAIKRILPTSNPDEYAACIGADMWNACRAAMLAAAPQSLGIEPATVPGKWIPVSERMPEAEGHYLVWANASRIDGYCDHLAIATYHGEEWSNEFNWLVNHWMPLPAAPQEPKP